MADESNKMPKVGDVVDVITSGDHDLFDPNTGIYYPMRTVLTVTFNRFHEDQMGMGNLKLASDKDAPKPDEENDQMDVSRETDLAAPVDTKSPESGFERDPSMKEEGDVTEFKLPVGTEPRKGRSRRGT